MCLTVPARVTQVQGAMAEVEEQEGGRVWLNALAQPDVRAGDYVLTHANLIVAIISEAEALDMLRAYQEIEELYAAEAGGAMTAESSRLKAHAAPSLSPGGENSRHAMRKRASERDRRSYP